MPLPRTGASVDGGVGWVAGADEAAAVALEDSHSSYV